MQNFLILRPKLIAFWLATFFFLFAFAFSFSIPFDPDLGWHMRYGEEIVQQHRILTVDTFTHTINGAPVVDNEWLSEVIFYLIYSHFSFLGLSIFSSVISALIYVLPLVFLKGKWEVKSLLLLLSLFGSSGVLSVGPRPQTFTLLLFVLFYLLLLSFLHTKKIRSLFPLPFLLLLWANMHPGYMVGIVLLLLSLVAQGLQSIFLIFSQKKKRILFSHLRPIFPLIIIFFVSLLFSTVHPTAKGVGQTGNLLQAISLPAKIAAESSVIGTVRTSISEWLPPLLVNIPGTVFILSIFIVFGLFVQKRFTIKDIIPLLFLSFFIYFSTLSRRNTPFFFLAATPLILLYADTVSNRFFTHRVMRVFLGFAFVAAVVYSIQVCMNTFATLGMVNGAMSSYCRVIGFPCDAIAFIKKTKPPGNLYNFYTWGGYLDWTLPQYPVFIDGRVPGSPLYTEFEHVFSVQSDWRDILEKYQVNVMLIPPHPLIEELVTQDGVWSIVFKDEKAIVLVKKKP